MEIDGHLPRDLATDCSLDLMLPPILHPMQDGQHVRHSIAWLLLVGVPVGYVPGAD